LSSVENKKQVISLIFDELIRDTLFHQESIQRHKLVVTGEDPCPIEVNMKGKRSRFDLETKHEEASIIIIHQVLHCAEQARQIAVMSDDTDVEWMIQTSNLMARKGQYSTLKQRWQSIRK